MDIRRIQHFPHRRSLRSSVVLATIALLAAERVRRDRYTVDAAGTATSQVFGAYATQIEEPWDGVIHSALEDEKDAGRIDVHVHR